MAKKATTKAAMKGQVRKDSPERKELMIQKRAELAKVEEGKKLPAETAEAKAAPAKVTTEAAPAKEAKKEPEKKATAPKKATKAKAAPKATAKTVEVENYFEIGGEQIKAEDIRAIVEQAYKDAGHRVGSIKKIQIYYNFEERRAYYVINDKAEGEFVEF